MHSMLWMCQFNSYNVLVVELDCSKPRHSAVCRLTIKTVDTHHKVYAVIKLLIVLLRGEVGQI